MLRATYEHIIHVESFKNIDLFNQGLYYLRFMIKSNGEQATPYNYFETNNNKKKESWQPSQIDEQYFQTRTFMIRFQEEEVEIDESCIFKIEMSASPHYEHEFKLICELMCAELAKIGCPPNEESLFKCVATFQGRICNSYKSVHEYVPIMFDNNHFCQVHCTVNSNKQFREVIKSNSFSNGTLCQKQHQDVSDQIRRKPIIMEQQLDIIDENLFSDQKQATVLLKKYIKLVNLRINLAFNCFSTWILRKFYGYEVDQEQSTIIISKSSLFNEQSK